MARARSDKGGRAVVGESSRRAAGAVGAADATARAADAAARDMIASAWRGP